MTLTSERNAQGAVVSEHDTSARPHVSGDTIGARLAYVQASGAWECRTRSFQRHDMHFEMECSVHEKQQYMSRAPQEASDTFTHTPRTMSASPPSPPPCSRPRSREPRCGGRPTCGVNELSAPPREKEAGRGFLTHCAPPSVLPGIAPYGEVPASSGMPLRQKV